MRKNKISLFIVCLVILIVPTFFQISVRAEYVPASNELLPTKDTYVVVYDSIGDSELDNFGGSDTLYTGNKYGDDCVTAIQFDFSKNVGTGPCFRNLVSNFGNKEKTALRSSLMRKKPHVFNSWTIT